jgi:hypothetical protein
LASPRAAAIAGILFSVLYGTALVMIKQAMTGEGATGNGILLERGVASIDRALNLIPFSGLAFLWFIGVVRDRVGKYEDKLFATIFLGSGLLYLAMIFVAAALARGIIAVISLDPLSINDPVVTYGRIVMRQITTIYALRMAGIFMTSFASIFLRNGLMPRWVGGITIVLAIVLLLSVNLSTWLELVFPAWVFMISLMILAANYQRRKLEEDANAQSV